MCEVTLEKLKIKLCETDKGEHFTYDNEYLRVQCSV